MTKFLPPILKNIDHYNSVGFQFSSIDGLKTVQSHSLQTINARELFGVFDLIAKAQVLNIKQFNGTLPHMLTSVFVGFIGCSWDEGFVTT